MPHTTLQSTARANLIKGYACLIFTAMLWGGAFVFQKNVTAYLDAFSFNFIRFLLGSLSLIPLLVIIQYHQKQTNKIDQPTHSEENLESQRYRPKLHSDWLVGGVAGGFMFMGISLQQIALAYTTTGKSGFITSLYIIMVPILALFIRQHCRLEVWLAAPLSVLGIYLLGMGGEAGNSETQLNVGDGMTLISAGFWAGQVLWLSIFAKYSNVVKVSIIQMLTCALLSLIMFYLFAILQQSCLAENNTAGFCQPWLQAYHLPSLADLSAAKWMIVYTGVISAGLAFTLQIYGQQFLPASNAALVMSLEGVFALLGGVFFLGEPLSVYVGLGCTLILTAIVLAQSQGFVQKQYHALLSRQSRA